MKQPPENLSLPIEGAVIISPPESEKIFSSSAQPLSDALRRRQEKLAVIRQAIENGAYDSPDRLEKALNRMIESLDGQDNSSKIKS